jgi:hypothetical protein
MAHELRQSFILPRGALLGKSRPAGPAWLPTQIEYPNDNTLSIGIGQYNPDVFQSFVSDSTEFIN